MAISFRNALTIDVEDYFQVSAFEPYVEREQWQTLPHRVERNTHRILDLVAEFDIKATFFTLGWVAERYPALIERMVAEGHEVASHGFEHIRVTQQKPEDFYQDIVYTKQLLEDIAGVAVNGYRAASYSIVKRTAWALESLQKAGYRYSSSVYPIRHDLYGWPEINRFAFYPDNAQELLEVPITTLTLFGKNFPCGGGGFFRLLPYPVSRWALQQVNRSDHQACVFYFHPWELDPDQPRQPNLNFKTQFRHYLNLKHMESRLRKLLRDFSWDRMDRIFLTPDPEQDTTALTFATSN